MKYPIPHALKSTTIKLALKVLSRLDGKEPAGNVGGAVGAHHREEACLQEEDVTRGEATLAPKRCVSVACPKAVRWTVGLEVARRVGEAHLRGALAGEHPARRADLPLDIPAGVVRDCLAIEAEN